jgi:hypothetical protein
MIPLAKSATPAAKAVLRQATALQPDRIKASDGLLPSAAHVKQNPDSDHNSGFGVDLSHDPAHGIDCADIFQKIKVDKRVKYIIFNGKIWSKERAHEGDRPYDGPNKHPHHIHISILENCGNDTSPWFSWMGNPTLVNKVKALTPKPLPKKENK